MKNLLSCRMCHYGGNDDRRSFPIDLFDIFYGYLQIDPIQNQL